MWIILSYRKINLTSLCDLDSTCKNNLNGYQGCFDSTALQIGMEVVFSIEDCIKSCDTQYKYAGITNGYIKVYYSSLIFFLY